jgi:hypothetical protein
MHRTLLVLALCSLIAVCACTFKTIPQKFVLHRDIYLVSGSQKLTHSIDNAAETIHAISAEFDPDTYYPELDILNPYNESLFPRDVASPTFTWSDQYLHSDLWLITIGFENNGNRIHVLTDASTWTPERDIWEIVKANSLDRKAIVTITGVDTNISYRTVTRTAITLSTSPDPIGAPIFYLQMPLPFARAKQYPERSLWRFGTAASYETPRIVIKNLMFCGNCHHFSQDGRVFGMDIDYRMDKGGYALTPTREHMLLTRKDLITWNDFNNPTQRKSQGFFSKISPDGKYVVSTVKEQSFFAMLSDLDFSQFFFPAQGLLACYSMEERRFFPLPGADDPRYVQTCPVWSPDGRYIVFSRAKVDKQLLDVLDGKNFINVRSDVRITDLNKKYQIKYDLYRVPFNNGKGGVPEPVAGASHNGRSNYFPRFSPDGKWIVFTQSETGLAIQPGSKLNIIPAQGGAARRMQCNTDIMNSWHSWSPNSRWLVFSSKVNTPYTQLFLTHIDQHGYDSTPVLLSRFSGNKLACIAPEFVNIEPDAIKEIRLTTN